MSLALETSPSTMYLARCAMAVVALCVQSWRVLAIFAWASVTEAQAKIANTRQDWTHKATTAIAQRAKYIVLGDVSSAKLIKTPFAKSTLAAAWHSPKTQIQYQSLTLDW